MAKCLLPALRVLAVAQAVVAGLMLACAGRAADLSYPYAARYDQVLTGSIDKVDGGRRRLTVIGEGNRPYVVHTYGAFVFLAGTRIGFTEDLKRGMRVEVTGAQTGRDQFEARSVRVAPEPAQQAASGGQIQIDGVVRDSDTARARATVADSAGRRFTVDYLEAAITGGGASRPGRPSWLARGMHVLVAGTRLPHSVVVADRVRILSGSRVDAPPVSTPAPVVALPPSAPALAPAPPPARLPVPAAPVPLVPPSPDPKRVLALLDTYTGILIDARHLPDIMRSPAPTIYGPAPGNTLLYPDRAHVPTPDQVQEASVVRYYRTEAEARAGVAGSNPLILPAQAVLGPARDGLQLSADDMTLLIALDNKVRFSRSWKVGFLVPANR